MADSITGISFQAPANMQPAAPTYLRQRQAELAALHDPGNPDELVPTQIYSDPSGRSRCFVSRFTNPTPDALSDPWIAAHEARVRQNVAPAEVRLERTELHGARALHFHIQNPDYVNVRLVSQAPGWAPFQIDFLVPRADIEGAERAIESSFGSIRFL